MPKGDPLPNPPLALRYTGDGGAFAVGVPIRDMTAEEVAGWHLPLAALLDAGYLVPANVEEAKRLGVWPRPKRP